MHRRMLTISARKYFRIRLYLFQSGHRFFSAFVCILLRVTDLVIAVTGLYDAPYGRQAPHFIRLPRWVLSIERIIQGQFALIFTQRSFLLRLFLFQESLRMVFLSY